MKVGKWNIRVNDRVMDMLLRKAVGIIDAMSSENHYLFDKNLQYDGLIDSESRNFVFADTDSCSIKMCITIQHEWNKGLRC